MLSDGQTNGILMSSALRSGIFRALDLPRPVFHGAFETYGRLHGYQFVQNPYLGDLVAPLCDLLLNDETGSLSLAKLVYSDNYLAIDYLLGKESLPNNLAFTIASSWNLTPNDVARLQRAAPGAAPDVVAHPSTKISTAIVPRLSIRPYLTENQDRMFCSSVTCADYSSFIRVAGDNGVYVLTSMLKDGLKMTIEEETRRAWAIFFGLIEDDSDIPLAGLMSTARSLARAESLSNA